MENKKILVVSLAAGAGHVRAAKALEKTARNLFPELTIRHIEISAYADSLFKTLYISLYDQMASHVPSLWGLVYKTVNIKAVPEALEFLSSPIKQKSLTPFYQEIEAWRPDHLICTHSVPAAALAHAPKSYQISAPLSLIITDYAFNNGWVVEGVNDYFVATEDIKKEIIANYPNKKFKITVSGIPIDPVFYEEKSAERLRDYYDIAQPEPVITILGGGTGLLDISELISELFILTKPLTIIAIAGKNEKMKEKILSLNPPSHVRLIPIGWTDRIDEYMRLADVVVSKPGGLTTTECLILGKPIIAVAPIPGQEEGNANFIVKRNLGKVARSGDELRNIALYYFSSPIFSTKNPAKNTPAAECILKTILSNNI